MLVGDYGSCSPKHHFASGPAEDILIAEAKGKMVQPPLPRTKADWAVPSLAMGQHPPPSNLKEQDSLGGTGQAAWCFGGLLEGTPQGARRWSTRHRRVG